MPDPLPGHAEILSRIFDALPSQVDESDSAARLALKRRLFLTLHVIFPDQLLPALDLIDRGFLTRICLKQSFLEAASTNKDAAAESVLPAVHDDVTSCPAIPGTYIAKSTVTKSKFAKTEPAQAAKTYLVQLRTWNCSCSAFTLEAMPRDELPSDQAPAADEKLFGGLSLPKHTVSGEAIPCCKHILASLLMDRWGHIFAADVDSRACSRDEMAGLVALV